MTGGRADGAGRVEHSHRSRSIQILCSDWLGVPILSIKVDMNLESTTLTAGWLATQYNEKGFVKSLPRLRMEMKRHACSKFTNSEGDIVSKLLLLQ